MSDVNVKVTKETYVVGGSTRESVLQSIDEHGPRRGDDHFVAYTSWDVTWGYDLRQDSAGLTGVANPVVSVGAHVILPDWKGERDAPGELRRRLARSFKAIKEHESEHVAMAIEAGQLALAKLRSVRPARRLTRASVDALVGAEIAVVQAREKKHDRVTKNGITQGTAI
jgi:predicted secreted Zn-dependent protease